MYKSLLIILILFSSLTVNANTFKAESYAITVNGGVQQNKISVEILIFGESSQEGFIYFYNPASTIPKDYVQNGKIFMHLSFDKFSVISNILKDVKTDVILSYHGNGRARLYSGKQVIGNKAIKNAHTHNGREHAHPLPTQGKAHKHGNGAVGQ